MEDNADFWAQHEQELERQKIDWDAQRKLLNDLLEIRNQLDERINEKAPKATRSA